LKGEKCRGEKGKAPGDREKSQEARHSGGIQTERKKEGQIAHGNCQNRPNFTPTKSQRLKVL